MFSLSSADFFKINFFKKIVPKQHQDVKVYCRREDRGHIIFQPLCMHFFFIYGHSFFNYMI